MIRRAPAGKWTTTIMRPEENPLGNLAAALAGPQGRIDPTRVLEIRRLLNRGADAPAAVAKYLGCGAENNVCVLFDQFEELFEHARRGGGTEAMLITDFLVGLAAKQAEGPARHPHHAFRLSRPMRAVSRLCGSGERDPVSGAAHGAAGTDAGDPRAGGALRRLGRCRTSPRG